LGITVHFPLYSENIKEMNQLPAFIPIVFILTTGLAWFIFKRAQQGRGQVMFIISAWLLFQAILGLAGFYQVIANGMPRFLLLILPPLIFLVINLSTARGRKLAGYLDLKWLTLLHILRIPVEIVLYWLFVQKAVPGIMTFEGRNFDILAGLTAPFIYYFGLVKNKLPLKVILAWNIISLGLLLNIVVIAVLSMPSPIQQFGFEQPDIALLHFPFIWLPGFLVPLVMFAHMVSIRQLLIRKASVLRS
jgi:hypothetical protein